MTEQVEMEYASYPSPRGRVAFVSGGASGLGAEFVRQLASQGAKVAFIDIDVERGRELEVELRDAALFVPCDVRDVGALRAAIARSADEIGSIRILVNNAANDRRYPVGEVDVALWDDLAAVNVRHHFFAAQAVAPMMREAGGEAYAKPRPLIHPRVLVRILTIVPRHASSI